MRFPRAHAPLIASVCRSSTRLNAICTSTCTSRTTFSSPRPRGSRLKWGDFREAACSTVEPAVPREDLLGVRQVLSCGRIGVWERNHPHAAPGGTLRSRLADVVRAGFKGKAPAARARREVAERERAGVGPREQRVKQTKG